MTGNRRISERLRECYGMLGKKDNFDDYVSRGGHDYRPDLPRFIREIYDLPCSDEQLANIETAVETREAVRAEVFARPAAESTQVARTA